MTILGVDLASVDAHRAPPDWVATKAACKAVGNTLGFAFFRASYGTLQDPTARMRIPAAREAGLTCGAYMFLRLSPGIRGRQKPTDQVEAFCESMAGVWKGGAAGSTFAPVIDIEDTKSSDNAVELQLAGEAIAALQREFGVPPIIYWSNRIWVEELGNPKTSAWTECPLWLAKPWPWAERTAGRLDPERAGVPLEPAVPGPWGEDNWWIHQYQGDAVQVPGLSGTVDLNRFNVMRRLDRGLCIGPRVTWVQRRVTTKFASGGYHGETDQVHVPAFQRKHGLVADGIIGPKTFAALTWTPPIAQ